MGLCSVVEGTVSGEEGKLKNCGVISCKLYWCRSNREGV